MKHTLTINGMHCKSCELLVKQSLNELDGCTVQSISHKTGICKIEYNQNDTAIIEWAINKLGYTINDDKDDKQPRTSDQRSEKIAWIGLAVVLTYILLQSNVSSLLPEYQNLSFTVAFIIWLVASLSTCLAVTWWIIIWYTESVQTHQIFWTQLKFHIGRIIAFVVWWWILGLIGSQFWGSLRFNAIFSILVGVVLLYIGLQLLGIVPNITKRWFHIPSWLSACIFTVKNPKYASIVWATTFLLPCWFTQSMQLFALQSGSIIQGSLIMGAFALGTLPVLFGLGLGVKYIKDKLNFINPLIASLLVVFWAYTLYNGSSLVQALDWSWRSISNSIIIKQEAEPEVVYVGHNGSQFVPYSIKLTVGKNYKIITTPSSHGKWCFYALIYQGSVYPIKKWESFEILVDGMKAKTIPLVCSAMGMKMGEIVIQ